MVYEKYCNNSDESRQVEQKFMDFFNSDLNTMRAWSKNYVDEDIDREIDYYLHNLDNSLLGYFTYNFYMDINNFTCEFCNKKFVRKNALENHKKTAQYCLKIQNKENEIKEHECKFCNKKFSSIYNLQKHKDKNCKEKNILKKINLLKEKEDMNTLKKINFLEDKDEKNNSYKIKYKNLENDYKKLEKDIENLKKEIKELKTNQNEIQIKKIDSITDLFKNKLISLEDYKIMIDI